MLHDLVAAIAPQASGGVPDGGGDIALIGLIGVLVTTLGGIIVAKVQRGKAAANGTTVKLITVPESHLDDLITERNKAQAAETVAESQCDQVTAENRLLRKAIGQLREAMIRDAITMPDAVLTPDVKAIL